MCRCNLPRPFPDNTQQFFDLHQPLRLLKLFLLCLKAINKLAILRQHYSPVCFFSREPAFLHVPVVLLPYRLDRQSKRGLGERVFFCRVHDFSWTGGLFLNSVLPFGPFGTHCCFNVRERVHSFAHWSFFSELNNSWEQHMFCHFNLECGSGKQWQ